MQRRVITSVFFALVLEGEHPEERLEKLNERRRKLLGYLEKAELAWVENPSEENPGFKISKVVVVNYHLNQLITGYEC